MDNKLELKHIKGYLDHNLRYHLPLTSERYESIFENEPWKFTEFAWAVENDLFGAKEYLKMTFTQPEPFIAIDNDELFLGQMKSSLGWEEDDVYLREMIPILRPISDLNKEIEHNGEKFIPLDKLTDIVDLNTNNFELRFEYRLFVLYDKINEYYTIQDNNFFFCEKLDEWHFDWKYDLINKGLAKNINTL